jgi:hypothetical protein
VDHCRLLKQRNIDAYHCRFFGSFFFFFFFFVKTIQFAYCTEESVDGESISMAAAADCAENSMPLMRFGIAETPRVVVPLRALFWTLIKPV